MLLVKHPQGEIPRLKKYIHNTPINLERVAVIRPAHDSLYPFLLENVDDDAKTTYPSIRFIFSSRLTEVWYFHSEDERDSYIDKLYKLYGVKIS
jgi:hypothetical protein